ncbi:hypothetical protein [Kocuria palustris]|uniref:hypothetical protein n=1 Tax=Kocuria palustris TaxID=71999 RepID=UPI0011A41E95|nr:hypothetical protein [Kocuria palustris]
MPSMKKPAKPTVERPANMNTAYNRRAAAGPVRKTTIELPTDLYKRLMREKVERDASLKDLIIEALEETYPEQ